jgi:hypothetical protein
MALWTIRKKNVQKNVVEAGRPALFALWNSLASWSPPLSSNPSTEWIRSAEFTGIGGAPSMIFLGVRVAGVHDKILHLLWQGRAAALP